MGLLDDKTALGKAAREVEAITAAELVLVVRARSATYRDAHYAFGVAVAVATLMALLYLPQEFPLWLFAVDLLASFVGFSVLAALVPAITRALVPAGRRARQVAESARAAFYDKGVSRTSGRWGVLVYASLLEQEVEVLADLGIEEGVVDEPTIEALRAAVAADDTAAFTAALAALGKRLAARYPRTEGDLNELDARRAVDAAS
ncbi:MAG: hypothetical protein IPJ34_29100 [Myxococcales bacterium]|nr:hypothetical protein [Myxococcales bacterium]